MAPIYIYDDGIVLNPDCDGDYKYLHMWQNDIKPYAYIPGSDIVRYNI